MVCFFWIFLCLIYPVKKTEAETIAIIATVPYTHNFGALVAQKSSILAIKKAVLAGEEWTAQVMISNGEINLKNKQFICNLKNAKSKKIVASVTGNTGESAWGEIRIKTNLAMLGYNQLECQVTNYSEVILVKNKPGLIVFPELKKASKIALGLMLFFETF